MANEKRLISADDFLDLFYVASAGQDKAFVKTVEMVVEDTPTIDAVEVVHGEWLQTKEPLGSYDVDCVECSHCRESWVIDEDLSFEDYCLWNYCPNCGAKMMDGGNEDV